MAYVKMLYSSEVCIGSILGSTLDDRFWRPVSFSPPGLRSWKAEYSKNLASTSPTLCIYSLCTTVSEGNRKCNSCSFWLPSLPPRMELLALQTLMDLSGPNSHVENTSMVDEAMLSGAGLGWKCVYSSSAGCGFFVDLCVSPPAVPFCTVCLKLVNSLPFQSSLSTSCDPAV